VLANNESLESAQQRLMAIAADVIPLASSYVPR
jgi:hypothetical protein